MDTSHVTVSVFDSTPQASVNKAWSAASLQAGVYSIEVTATYESHNASDVTYVNIKRSGLEAIIDGGSLKTVQQGTTVYIDAQSRTVDPEVGNIQDKSGMRFSWIITKDSVDVTSSVVHYMTSQSNPEIGFVYVDTSQLQVGTYVVNATVFKDTRTASAVQTITTAAGYIPVVDIR